MRIWSHLLKKSLMENTIFCAVTVMLDCFKDFDFRMMDIVLLLLLYLSLLHSYYYYYYYYPLYHSIIAIFDLLSLWFFFRFTYICPLRFNVTSLWSAKQIKRTVFIWSWPGLHIWASEWRVSPELPHLQSTNSPEF